MSKQAIKGRKMNTFKVKCIRITNKRAGYGQVIATTGAEISFNMTGIAQRKAWIDVSNILYTSIYILRLFIKQIHENKFWFVQSSFGINFFVDDKLFSYIENRNKQTFPFKAKTTYMVQVKTFDKNY